MSAATIDRALREVREPGARKQASSRAAFGGDPAQRGGAHLRRLGRSAAGVRRSGPRGTQRADGEGQLRADVDADGHRDGLDGVCAVAGARAEAVDRGVERDAPTNAVPAARVRHGQRQRVHERDDQKLLRRSGAGVHAVPSVSQERPGLGRAEERGRGQARGWLPALRGSGSGGGTGDGCMRRCGCS